MDAQKSLLERALLESAQITRYAVKDRQPDPGHVVLSTHGEVAFIEKGLRVWQLDLSQERPLQPGDSQTPHTCVDAQWLNTQQALESDVEVVHGGSANTFGGVGALLVPDGFHIPTVLATPENVAHYGLQLLKNHQQFAISSPQHPIIMMRYDYSKDYKQEFLMKEYGGGGIFVETHNFPHIHIPVSPSCGGYIVIGKAVEAHQYHFTAFQIPYGFALYTPANTIHGDGTLVGEYALTVADSAMVTADTVLMYNENTRRMAHQVVPDWQPK